MERSVDEARTLFQKRCAVCHGLNGLGDGLESASLFPKPANFGLVRPSFTLRGASSRRWNGGRGDAGLEDEAEQVGARIADPLY